MLEAIISHYTNGNKAKFATLIGVSAQTISAWGTRNTFDSELIYTKCIGISAEWLLTGKGSMLRREQSPKTTSAESSLNEESLLYKMYEKKDAEVSVLKEEIGALKLRISQLEAQNKKTELQSKESEYLEGFTSESLESYGESPLPTKQPIVSRRSSAGKI